MASELMSIISEMASSAGILANATAVAMGAAGDHCLSIASFPEKFRIPKPA